MIDKILLLAMVIPSTEGQLGEALAVALKEENVRCSLDDTWNIGNQCYTTYLDGITNRLYTHCPPCILTSHLIQCVNGALIHTDCLQSLHDQLGRIPTIIRNWTEVITTVECGLADEHVGPLDDLCAGSPKLFVKDWKLVNESSCSCESEWKEQIFQCFDKMTGEVIQPSLCIGSERLSVKCNDNEGCRGNDGQSALATSNLILVVLGGVFYGLNCVWN